MQAQISGLAIRLGETRITSPIAGYVSARRLDPGALVGPPGGGAIVTVVRMDRLRVFLTLNETDAMGVAVGMDAHVELDALPGRSFSGKVVRVAPSFDPLTRTLEAEVQLANESGELRPGMYGRGSIRREIHPNTPVVSVNAVQISSEQEIRVRAARHQGRAAGHHDRGRGRRTAAPRGPFRARARRGGRHRRRRRPGRRRDGARGARREPLHRRATAARGAAKPAPASPTSAKQN